MADAGQPGKSDPAPRDQPAHPAFRLLRPLLIAAVLVVAGSLGWHFKSRSDPGQEPASFGSRPPQYVNAYVTDTRIRIKVTVTLGQDYQVNYGEFAAVKLRPRGYTDFDEKIGFTATSPVPIPAGGVIITSSIRPEPGASDYVLEPGSAYGRVGVFQPSNTIGKNETRYAVWFPLFAGKSWSGTAFLSRVPLIFQANGSVFGHLPSVGLLSYLAPPPEVFQGEYNAVTGQPSKLFTSIPAQVPAGEREAVFVAPNQQASYAEVIQQIGPALASTQSAYMNPADNAAAAQDYEWQSSGIDSLQPVFKAVDLDAAGSQSQAAFYSGIAFGVAGSAVIALIQEIPAEWRKRKSPTEPRAAKPVS